ncbi:hypothetical protein M5K25_008521 [Dendrobium thyrsiflorum]|uniref:Uncharacterized protein n=1 Tax=Dendrobium thyrsiflorum TaxID=117978 RepID=A0ABD0VG05_DENTH
MGWDQMTKNIQFEFMGARMHSSSLLMTAFLGRTIDFQNQFSSIHEKIDGRFAALEDLMKKMIDDKQKPASSETIGGPGRGGNPNPSGGRENPEVEVLEGDDGMPPLEPLSREELSRGYDRREAEYVGRREEFYRRGAGFERIQHRGADFEGERADFHRRCADFKRIQRRGADFEGRREEIHRRGADFEGIQRRGDDFEGRRGDKTRDVKGNATIEEAGIFPLLSNNATVQRSHEFDVGNAEWLSGKSIWGFIR